MPIEFACESCAKLLRVPDGTSGSSCQCPACGVLLEIPDPNAIEIVDAGRGQASKDHLQIPCPKCNFKLVCKPSLLGTKGQCRNCKYIFLISTDAQAAGNATEAQPTGLVFSCPKCDQLFEGKEDMRGRKGKCHTCGEVFPIVLKSAEQPEVPVREATHKRASSAHGPASKQFGTSPASTQASAAAQGTIRIACGSCEGVMEVARSAAGQTTACPYCQQLLQIPTATGAPPSPAPQSPVARTPQRKQASPAARTEPAPANSTRATQQPQSDLWTELGDLSNAGTVLPPANPHQTSATTEYEAPVRRRPRSGVTVSNVFGLAFETAFPSCLLSGLAYIGLSILSAAIVYGSAFLLGMVAGVLELDQGSLQIAVGIMGLLGAIVNVCITAAALAIVCHGALGVVRKRQPELFSTGNALVPMILFLLAASLIVIPIVLIPQGLSLISPSLAILGALLALPLMLAFYFGICLAPIAVADGDGPIEAMNTSLKIISANLIPMVGVFLCLILTGIAVTIITVLTCGLGGILLAFPMYILAAAYHLATR